MPTFKNVVKPSDFDTSNGFCGSELRKCEAEIMACNIVVISKKNGDQWSAFTFDDYKRLCSSKRNFRGEEDYLDSFVNDGILSKKDGAYSVTEKFFRVLARFIKE